MDASWSYELLRDLRSCGTSMGAAWCHSVRTNDMRARTPWPPCPNISPPPIGRPRPSPLPTGEMVLLAAEDLRVRRQMVRMTAVEPQHEPSTCADVHFTQPSMKACVDRGPHSQLRPRTAPQRQQPRNNGEEKLCGSDSSPSNRQWFQSIVQK